MKESRPGHSRARAYWHSWFSRSIGYPVFVEAVFGYHQPEIFKVFAESIFKLRKYGVEGFVIRGGNGLCAEIADSVFGCHGNSQAMMPQTLLIVRYITYCRKSEIFR
jgi:hypothetical protein